MNERIKELRKALNLTQDEFGSKIGVKRNTVAQYEIGRGSPLDSVVFSICREFGVNEDWLRNGIGEMFTFVPTEEIEALAHRYNLPDMAKRIVKSFVELDAQEMQAVISFIGRIVVERDDATDNDKILNNLDEAQKTIKMYRAAKSKDGAEGGQRDIPLSDYKKLKDAPEVDEI